MIKKTIVDQAGLFSLNDAKITIEQGLAIDNDMAKDRLKAQSEEKRSRQQIARLIYLNYPQVFFCSVLKFTKSVNIFSYLLL